MTKSGASIVEPRLRFPEFRKSGGWKSVSLKDVSLPVVERVGDRKLTPVSISAGIGFVPQAEKFGRDISGNQYKLYTLVRDGDFVYNKGNSFKFPQGCVYLLDGWGEVAAPNVFICFRLKNGFSNAFFQNVFEKNAHGMQLKKHITSGARSNGLLNISKENFFGIELPIPSTEEQRKIADCLTSIDEVIAAQTRKVTVLKKHKRGLTQQIFPEEGQALPLLRFSEFVDAPEWTEVSIGGLGDVITGNTPATSRKDYYGGNHSFVSPSDISELRFILSTRTKLTEAGFAQSRPIPPGSTLFVCIGSTIGKVAQNAIACATNQQINSVVANSNYSDDFVYHLLESKSEMIAALAGRHAVPIINKTQFSSILVSAPELAEQRRIADFLSSVDANISAESSRLVALKAHKRALLEQLFPAQENVW